MKTALLGLLIFITPLVSTAQIECFTVVTESIVLDHDLFCSDTALIVGAPNITIDLGGHKIQGSGSGLGVAVINNGFDNVTIRNGMILDMTGVVIDFASSNRVLDIEVRTSIELRTSGIFVASSDNIEIARATVSGFAGAQIFIIGNTDTTLRASRVLGVGFEGRVLGIRVENSNRTLLINNSASDFSGLPGFDVFASGILALSSNRTMLISNRTFGNSVGIEILSGANSTVRQNVSSDNRTAGIVVSSENTRITANRTDRNGFATLRPGIADGIFAVGANRIDQNQANRNFNLGIFAEGAQGGGGNRARQNGNPLQCVGIRCN